MTFFLLMNSGGREGRKEGRTDGRTGHTGRRMHTTKVSKKARNQRNPLEGQPKPTTTTTTTTTTITSTHREDAHHNSSTLDTQLVENAITRTILLETTYTQHSGLIFCPYLPSIAWRVACMYIVHLHLLCDGTKWGEGKMEENQVARESPTNLEIDLHLFSYCLISYSRSTLSYYNSMGK
jgi:hypothetical protein